MPSELEPKPDESALAFVERMDATGVSNAVIDLTLKEYFGVVERHDRKSLRLKSAVFWEKFYLERAESILKRGGSRYAAIKFISRKNGKSGQRILTDKEVNELVDAVGPWQR